MALWIDIYQAVKRLFDVKHCVIVRILSEVSVIGISDNILLSV